MSQEEYRNEGRRPAQSRSGHGGRRVAPSHPEGERRSAPRRRKKSSPCPVPVSAAPATSAWRSASRTRSSPAPPKASSGPAGREAFSGGKAAARFPRNPGKSPPGTAASWVPGGRIPACRRNHFPGLAISVPFNPIPPNASGLAAAFPRFSSPFKKTRGLPCVLRDISRDWKPHQNLRTGTFSRGAASFAFPIMNALIVLTQADQPCKESRSRGYHG